MINLLPTEQISTNRANYIKALWSVSLWFLTAIIGASAILLASLWGVLAIKQETLQHNLIVVRSSNEGQVLDQAETTARVLKQQLARAVTWSGPVNITLPSTLLADVLERPRGIYLNNLDYLASKEGVAEITVTGIAESRAALIAYQKQLNSKTNFSSVVSPLSNFIISINTPFTLTLKVATSTKNI
ncbi:MAG: hypothetical protein HYV76_01905 [Candidatus Vogelbacteria bacterium]|nr:hypothetical protein [Candidatus Vogelbacteria bacterium]